MSTFGSRQMSVPTGVIQANIKQTASEMHWNKIYLKKDVELGWYEDHDQIKALLQMLDENKVPLDAAYIAGNGTSCLVEELLDRSMHLIVNDIAEQALQKLQCRLQAHKYYNRVIIQYHDLSTNMADTWYDNGIELTKGSSLWIDRAVLHFLLQEEEITSYFSNLQKQVLDDGWVLFALFPPDGADTCAGLPVKRYSQADLQQRLGPLFKHVASMNYTYKNSYHGFDRPFLYTLWQRVSKDEPLVSYITQDFDIL